MNRRAPAIRPGRDHYQHQPVVGPYRVEPERALRTATYFGLSQRATLVYGTFRRPDGGAYSALRKIGWGCASPLAIQANVEGGPFRLRPIDAFKGWGVNESLADGLHVYESSAGTAAEPFRIEHGSDSLAWREGTSLELAGSLVGGCGVHWYDPSPPGGMYASEQYRVTGTLLGTPVAGFVAFDQLYLPPGMTWFESPYFSSPPYLEIAWNTFATEFDDGTVQAGQVMFGGQRLSFAVMVDHYGPALFSRDVSAEIIASPDGYPSEVRYLIDGEPWVWTAAEREQMPDFAKGYPDDTYRPSEGLFTRADEKRRPVAWWSFLDSWVSRRLPW